MAHFGGRWGLDRWILCCDKANEENAASNEEFLAQSTRVIDLIADDNEDGDEGDDAIEVNWLNNTRTAE